MIASLEKLPTRELVQTEKARRYLREYIRQSWPVIEPGTEYLHNWHIDAISEYLEAVKAGEIKRLLINMPPRYMKSICVTVDWPTWSWINDPKMKWLFTSYSQDLATTHSIARRRIMESDWYQARWGHVFQMTTDQNVKTEYENNHRGIMYSFGLQGTVTGKGGDIIVVDDPHNPKQAESDAQRQAAIDIFDRTLYSRLNNKKKGAIVVVMQRLHEADMAQHCVDLKYTHLNLPAEAPARTVITLPISKREIVREEDELLWPEREGPEEIAAAKLAMGSYGYAGQYQQEPAPVEGGMLKRKWWRFWYPKGQKPQPVFTKLPDGRLFEHPMMELPEQWSTQVQSWDMTFKDTKGSDYVSGEVWGKNGARFFLLDYLLERLDFPATLEAVMQMTTAWPKARTKLVEDKANGPAVIAVLHNKIAGMIAVDPKGGKMARVAAVSPWIESGNCYLPHPSLYPWVSKFMDICAQFPNGKIDDPIDSMTQALFRMGPGASTIVTF